MSLTVLDSDLDWISVRIGPGYDYVGGYDNRGVDVDLHLTGDIFSHFFWICANDVTFLISCEVLHSVIEVGLGHFNFYPALRIALKKEIE